MVTQKLTSASVLDPEEGLARSMHQTATDKPESPDSGGLLHKIRHLSKSTKLKLKIGFSLAMFAGLFIFGKIDLSKTVEVAMQANLPLLVIAAAIFTCTIFVNASRWQVLARAVGLDRPLSELIQYCFVGIFFNLFLPSTVGGDVSRCYYISKGTHKYKAALYSVLADRVVGISVLFLFASLGILFSQGAKELPWTIKGPVFLGALGIFVGIPLLPAVAKKILGPDHWITARFTNSAARVYWRDGRMIAVSLAQSIFLQILLVACHIVIGLSLGLSQVPIWYYFVFYPIVAVLGFVTPSFNGIGVREGAYTYFLMHCPGADVGAIVDKAHAFTYAIIWLTLNTCVSLLGGLVYLAGHFKFSEAEAEKLQHDVIEEPEEEDLK